MPCWRDMESRNAEWRDREHHGSRTVDFPQSRVDRPLEGKAMKILRLNQLNASSTAHGLPPNADGRKKGRY